MKNKGFAGVGTTHWRMDIHLLIPPEDGHEGHRFYNYRTDCMMPLWSSTIATADKKPGDIWVIGYSDPQKKELVVLL